MSKRDHCHSQILLLSADRGILAHIELIWNCQNNKYRMHFEDLDTYFDN